jgi:hypothetical protein
VLSSRDFDPVGLAIDGTSVYWASAGRNMSVPKVGGDVPTTLCSGDNSGFIAVDGARAYWTTGDIITPGYLKSVPLSGGSPTVLASELGYPWDIAVHRGNVYWTNRTGGTLMAVPVDGGEPRVLFSGSESLLGLAIDDTNVYWAASTAGSVMRMPLGGGAPVTLASNQEVPFALAVDATSVYWTSSGDGTVMKLTPK